MPYLLTALETKSLVNSLMISAGTATSAVFIALIVSYAFYFKNIRGIKTLNLLLFVPLLIPPYLHAFSWMHLIRFLGELKLLGPYSCCGAEILSSITGSIFILTLSYFTAGHLIISRAIKNISPTSIISAFLVSNEKRVLKKVIFPQILPGILTAWTITFILSFITFDVPAFLGVNTYVTQIFKSYTLSGGTTRAYYLSFLPVIVVFAGLLLMLRPTGRRKIYSSRTSQKSNIINNNRNTTSRKALILFVVLLISISTVIPIGVLLYKNLTEPASEFNLLSELSVIQNTLYIAIGASFLTLMISGLIFSGIYKHNVGRILTLSLFALPPITFAILFIHIFNRNFLDVFYGTPLVLAFAYALRFSPIVCELFYIRKMSLNPELFAAAQLTEKSTIRRFFAVIFPLYLPAVIVAWILCIWFTATELPITLLIQPPGFQTIITRLFIVLHYGAVELMAPMTTALIVISLLPIAGIIYYIRFSEKNGQK